MECEICKKKSGVLENIEGRLICRRCKRLYIFKNKKVRKKLKGV
jgi:uncharacterized protein YbaR (Trm112 family)